MFTGIERLDITYNSSGFMQFAVSDDYVSGAAISIDSVFAGTTPGSMNLVDGTYSYTWGTATQDTLTVNVNQGVAVPEPGSLAVLAAAGVGLVFVRRRKA